MTLESFGGKNYKVENNFIFGNIVCSVSYTTRNDLDYGYVCWFYEEINMLALDGLKNFDSIQIYYLWLGLWRP